MNFNIFSKLLLKWNEEKNFRQMPWKGEKDPYKIWLSEIILQQTRVEQGWNYYHRFIAAYPNIKELALADDKQVFKLWEGLGYYSRCRNLLATARYIYQEHNGIFPTSYELILQLKGVGSYTAAAIASFAYNLPYAVVDGNVYRVLTRIFGITDAIDSHIGKKKINELALQLMDKRLPGIYNQAIMDFGATICKPVTPLCLECPFKKECIAFTHNKIEQLPVKNKKLKTKNRTFYFFLIQYQNKIALRERQEKDIWQHLHEFPLIELGMENNVDEAITLAQEKGWLHKNDTIKMMSTTYKQKLTHQTIYGIFITIDATKKPKGLMGYEWANLKAIHTYSFPKIINDFLKKSL